MGEKVHGEGNYKATRDYNASTKKFIDSGKVDQAAKDAEPRNDQEARELQEAERIGKSHLKEDDAPEAAPASGPSAASASDSKVPASRPPGRG